MLLPLPPPLLLSPLSPPPRPPLPPPPAPPPLPFFVGVRGVVRRPRPVTAATAAAVAAVAAAVSAADSDKECREAAAVGLLAGAGVVGRGGGVADAGIGGVDCCGRGDDDTDELDGAFVA